MVWSGLVLTALATLVDGVMLKLAYGSPLLLLEIGPAVYGAAWGASVVAIIGWLVTTFGAVVSLRRGGWSYRVASAIPVSLALALLAGAMGFWLAIVWSVGHAH